MNEDQLLDWIEALIRGELAPEEHQELQAVLIRDADARRLFRERMDLEAGLRTWAGEGAGETTSGPARLRDRTATPVRLRVSSRWMFVAALAASILILVGFQLRWAQVKPDPSLLTANRAEHSPNADSSPNRGLEISYVGMIRQRNDCQWSVQPVGSNGRFATGQLSLAKGAVNLVFDSGTEMVLEAPCEMQIHSKDSATLLSGNAFVNVKEQSDGFVLETPEARIVDLGTQYAVAMADDSTEVHVFDGSVIWIPNFETSAVQDRINQGEARRYLRSQPSLATRIPFGQRQFVRRIEADIHEQFGEELLAYDGFENIAGRVRRGRSGFGFDGGWIPTGRGFGKAANTEEAPSDTVFGHNRDQRRLLSLTRGDDIRRSFEKPIRMASHADEDSESALFVSLLIERPTPSGGQDRSLRISLEPDLPGRGRSLHQIISFGITDDGLPFVGEKIAEAEHSIVDTEVCFVVLKMIAHHQEFQTSMRVFRSFEIVGHDEPEIWTASASEAAIKSDINSIRIRCGDDSVWRVDELRVGRTWRSVTRFD